MAQKAKKTPAKKKDQTETREFQAEGVIKTQPVGSKKTTAKKNGKPAPKKGKPAENTSKKKKVLKKKQQQRARKRRQMRR